MSALGIVVEFTTSTSLLDKHSRNGPSTQIAWMNWVVLLCLGRVTIASSQPLQAENFDIAVGHGKTVTVRNLDGILPSRYVQNKTPQDVNLEERIVSRARGEVTDLGKGVQELKNQLETLQRDHEAQSCELASALKDLETSILSIAAKNRQIGTLTAEVDHWKRSDAAKAEELAATHKELEERRRDSEELIAIREELRFSQSQTIHTRRWYDEQFRHLQSVVEQSQRTPLVVQNFISQTDALAETNIIETLQRLNENIDWSSTFIADRVIHTFQPRTTDPTEEQASIATRVADCIGQPLVNRLRSNSRTEIAAYLTIAFRAYLIYHLCEVMSSWSTDSGLNRVVCELYDAVRKLESQTISARWRSLTYASISSTCSNSPDMFIAHTMDGLYGIIVTAGCAPSTSAAKDMIALKLRHRISSILSTAGQLTKSIMDTLSADYRVEAILPFKTFDDRAMDIDASGPGKKSRSQFVLCTTQMGLSKEVTTQSKVGPNKTNTLATTNVVKAKVMTG